MQRPTRIKVFGILCLVVASLSGLLNIAEFSLALLGPKAIAQIEYQKESKAFADMFEQSVKPVQAALHKPTFRTLSQLESMVGIGMAVVLLFTGVGLLMNKPWSPRLARIWSFYAFGAAVVTAVLFTQFVLPESPDYQPGSELPTALVALVQLWLFPVLLLSLIGRAPVVAEYLQWAAGQAGGSVSGPSDAQPAARHRPTTPTPRSSPTSASGMADGLRDDPWNDPNSR